MSRSRTGPPAQSQQSEMLALTKFGWSRSDAWARRFQFWRFFVRSGVKRMGAGSGGGNRRPAR